MPAIDTTIRPCIVPLWLTGGKEATATYHPPEGDDVQGYYDPLTPEAAAEYEIRMVPMPIVCRKGDDRYAGFPLAEGT